MTALLIAVGAVAYLTAGAAHVVLMGETNHTYRVGVTLCWPLLYLIAAGIVIGSGYHALIDHLQGVHLDELD